MNMTTSFLRALPFLMLSFFLMGCDDSESDRSSTNLTRAKEDLNLLIEASKSLDGAQGTTDGLIRHLIRANDALESGYPLHTNSLLTVALLHAQRHSETGLLDSDEATSLVTAISYVLAKLPGSENHDYDDPSVSEQEFLSALRSIEDIGLRTIPVLEPTTRHTWNYGVCQPSAATFSPGIGQVISQDAKSIFSNLVDEVPVAGWMLSSLVEIFWPSSEVTAASIWKQIRAEVEKLIGEKIADEVKEQVDDQLAGLQDALRHSYLDDLSTDPPQAGAIIFGDYRGLLKSFEIAEPSFQQEGYELLLLPEFAMFADLYLALLVDGIRHVETWGKDVETPAQLRAYAEELQKTLVSLIADDPNSETSYLTYTKKWFDDGLKKVTYPVADDFDYSFLCRNLYSREMTLTVLDHAAYWPYLDPEKYPKGTKVKLTREIFSDPQGKANPITVDSTVKEPITHLNVWSFDRVDAMQVAYGGALGPRMGGTGGVLNGNFDVGKAAPHGHLAAVYGRSGDVLNSAGFTFSDGTPSPPFGNAPGGDVYGWEFGDQILSSIKIMGEAGFPYRSANSVVYGFRHADSY